MMTVLYLVQLSATSPVTVHPCQWRTMFAAFITFKCRIILKLSRWSAFLLLPFLCLFSSLNVTPSGEAFLQAIQLQAGSVLPDFMSLLQTSWKRSDGLPACLVPNSPYSLSLGICPWFMQLTCPSHLRHFWSRMLYMLGMLALDKMSWWHDPSMIVSWFYISSAGEMCSDVFLGMNILAMLHWHREVSWAHRPDIPSSWVTFLFSHTCFAKCDMMADITYMLWQFSCLVFAFLL